MQFEVKVVFPNRTETRVFDRVPTVNEHIEDEGKLFLVLQVIWDRFGCPKLVLREW